MSRLFQVSARDHSALILMSELAKSHATPERFVSLQSVADAMHLSQGYLEEVAGLLRQAGLISGRQGPHGGYRLARSPEHISLEDILVALEGPVELVDCQAKHLKCPVEERCSSKHVWNVLQQAIQASLKSTTLNQIM